MFSEDRCFLERLIYRKVKVTRGISSMKEVESKVGTTLLMAWQIMRLLCHFCGESEHVATMGPFQSKVIQYFACKRFVEMNPGQRGLCFQCLFPGASSTDGKHRDGKCQRAFSCRHPLHQKYPRKKHVLVCEEHKDEDDNKTVRHDCKKRCILKERKVELSFHTNATAYPIPEESAYGVQMIADRAVYLKRFKSMTNVTTYVSTVDVETSCQDMAMFNYWGQKLNKIILNNPAWWCWWYVNPGTTWCVYSKITSQGGR